MTTYREPESAVRIFIMRLHNMLSNPLKSHNDNNNTYEIDEKP